MGCSTGHRNETVARTPLERLAWLQGRLRMREEFAAMRRKDVTLATRDVAEAERDVELMRAEIEEQKQRVAAEDMQASK